MIPYEQWLEKHRTELWRTYIDQDLSEVVPFEDYCWKKYTEST